MSECRHEMNRGSHLRFDGVTWPNPSDPAEVQWRLRYGTPCKHDLLVAASFMHAYAHLIEMPQRQRNQRVRQIRAATPTTQALRAPESRQA